MKLIKSLLLVLFLLSLVGCSKRVDYRKVYVEEDGTVIEYGICFFKGAFNSAISYRDYQIRTRYTEDMVKSDYITSLNKVMYDAIPDFLDNKSGFEKYVYTILKQVTYEWGSAGVTVETDDKITSYICYLGSRNGNTVYNFYECINYKVRKENGTKEPECN